MSANGVHILKFLESFEEDGKYFCVKHFMEGGSLLDYLIRQDVQPLSEQHTRFII